MTYKQKLSVVFLSLLVIAVICTVVAFSRPSLYRSFPCPDGAYDIVVLRKASFGARMPGQGSDAPGIVQLRDAQGRVLRQTDVAMVQLVETVEWKDDSVYIKLIADWPLP